MIAVFRKQSREIQLARELRRKTAESGGGGELVE